MNKSATAALVALSWATTTGAFRPPSSPIGRPEFSIAVASPTPPTSEPAAVTDARLSISGHDPEAWKNGYTSCTEEVPPTVLDFPDLPSDFPVGTYYRNGQ